MYVGDYVRTKKGLIVQIININEFREPSMKYGVAASYLNGVKFIGDNIIKLAKENPIDLIEPQDLMFIDIDNGFAGGIIVPRVAETPDELTKYIKSFKNKETTLVGIVTHEQLDNCMYKVGDK